MNRRPGMVTFSSAVDPASFTTADVLTLTAPGGAPIAISQIVDVTPVPAPGQ